MTDAHPDQVLRALKQKAKRSNKVRNLESVHSTCAEIYEVGGGDFTYATVGRMAERSGGPAATTLYTSASSDYRILIDAWAAHAKANRKRRPLRSEFATDDDLLRKVDDPAVRTLLAMAVSERNRLKSQLDTLKSQANLVIDIRPLPGISNLDASTGNIVTIISPLEGLTSSEIDALGHAISLDFLNEKGWLEGADGEICDRTGRKLYKPGYCDAIRRILEAAKASQKSKNRGVP